VPTVSQVLHALLASLPFEAINVMGIPPDDPYAKHGDPTVWQEYRRLLAAAGSSLTLEPILKWDFYKAVESTDHVLTIQTADQALWANVLLTIGVRTP
jgi:L-fucose mutarotase